MSQHGLRSERSYLWVGPLQSLALQHCHELVLWDSSNLIDHAAYAIERCTFPTWHYFGHLVRNSLSLKEDAAKPLPSVFANCTLYAQLATFEIYQHKPAHPRYAVFAPLPLAQLSLVSLANPRSLSDGYICRAHNSNETTYGITR